MKRRAAITGWCLPACDRCATDVDKLRACYEALPGDRAAGVDGVTKEQYGEKLEENFQGLSPRLRRMGYKPQPKRRSYIPKPGSEKGRPLYAAYRRKKDMDTSKILWVDLRFIQGQVSSYHHLDKDWAVSCINNTERLGIEIRKTLPTLLCFEYDFPDVFTLSALRRTRCLLPSMPIIMLTEQHSETLAIWALRNRVWDYFVKPIQPQELMASAATILEQNTSPKDEMAQLIPLYSPLPAEVRFQHHQKKKTYPAKAFVQNHYHEKIYEKEVAQLCEMNTCTFSRSFKKEHEMTFRDYLINYRISKARELLQNPNASVTDIAYTVGFQDSSYFTRTFRRIVGMSPSHYRETYKIH